MDHEENGAQTGEGAPAKLTQEAMERMVERLYYRQQEMSQTKEKERQMTLSRSVCETKTINKEDEEKLVHRMYDEQLERFRTSKDEREKKVETDFHRNDIQRPREEIEAQVDRMYTQELEKSQAKRSELQKKYGSKPKGKSIPAAQIKEAAERLSHVDYEARDEKLFAKHVYPFDPKVKKITKEEVAAMASRLCAAKQS